MREVRPVTPSCNLSYFFFIYILRADFLLFESVKYMLSMDVHLLLLLVLVPVLPLTGNGESDLGSCLLAEGVLISFGALDRRDRRKSDLM